MVVAIIIVILVVNVLAASKFQQIVELKGYTESYFLWCLVLGIAGWLMVAALPDRAGDTAAKTPAVTMFQGDQVMDIPSRKKKED